VKTRDAVIKFDRYRNLLRIARWPLR